MFFSALFTHTTLTAKTTLKLYFFFLFATSAYFFLHT